MFHYLVTHQSRFGEEVYSFSTEARLDSDVLSSFDYEDNLLCENAEAQAIVDWLGIDYTARRDDEFITISEIEYGPIWKGIIV